jgi:hypothetical protein
MAMTAADKLELQKQFVSLDDYEKDKNAINARVDCVEKSQVKNDLVVVRIDTQLKLILWLLSAIGIAIIALVVRQFWGIPIQ